MSRIKQEFSPSEKLNLHLGCGRRHLGGYKHLDLIDLPHIDYRCDVRDLHMYEDGAVDMIYAAHVLEYFDRVEVLDVLREWRRVLKGGCTLRLSVPDFWALIEVYHKTSNLALIHGPLYGIIRVDEKMLRHKTVYDFVSLSTLLQSAGFHHIRQWNPFTVLPADYDDMSKATFPHMDRSGIIISLNVEADKNEV